MEITSSSTNTQERENPSPTNSPHSNGSTATAAANGGSSLHLTPPPTPSPRSHEPNPYPTTFVQADTATFKQVVQMLTGSSHAAAKPDPSAAARGGIPPTKTTAQKKQGFKLYERRNTLKNGLIINTFVPGLARSPSFSPRKPEILSPSILDFPALALSPATPVNEERAAADQEEKALAEKKFYLHPSPRTSEPPQLLPLFPITSPRVSGDAN